MHLNKSRYFIFLFVFFAPIFTMGQDILFSQFYSNPLSLNPALSGNVPCARINTAYRNQWVALPKAYRTYYLSYDQFVPQMNSGFGVTFYNDQQANNALSTFSGGGSYSFKFRLTRATVVSLGLEATYNQISLHWDKLVFQDQIQLNGETISVSNEMQINNKNVSYLDFSTGVAFDWKEKIYGGVAFQHLSEPSNSFYDDKYSTVPMKVTVHGGAYFDVLRGKKSNITISPNILFQKQAAAYQLNFGMYVKNRYFVLGTWFRHNIDTPDAVIALVGFKKEGLKIGYSYDMTVSKLNVGSGGTHEITLTYQFCIYANDKKRKIRAIKCPEF